MATSECIAVKIKGLTEQVDALGKPYQIAQIKPVKIDGKMVGNVQLPKDRKYKVGDNINVFLYQGIVPVVRRFE